MKKKLELKRAGKGRNLRYWYRVRNFHNNRIETSSETYKRRSTALALMLKHRDAFKEAVAYDIDGNEIVESTTIITPDDV